MARKSNDCNCWKADEAKFDLIHLASKNKQRAAKSRSKTRKINLSNHT